MGKLKKLGNRIFVDGLAGMAHGLFATLIIGTIIQQIGTLIGGNVGDLIFAIGKVAAALTGAGIGVGVAITLLLQFMRKKKKEEATPEVVAEN